MMNLLLLSGSATSLSEIFRSPLRLARRWRYVVAVGGKLCYPSHREELFYDD
jgi:hypothetical protein